MITAACLVTVLQIRVTYSSLCTNHIWGNCNCYDYDVPLKPVVVVVVVVYIDTPFFPMLNYFQNLPGKDRIKASLFF